MFGILAAIVLAGVAFWLFRTTAADLDAVATVLGLRPAAARTQTLGTSPEGFAYHETTLLEGVLLGATATLGVRTVKQRHSRYRRRGSQMTVLSLRHGNAAPTRLRLQPAGMLESLEWLQTGETQDVVSTGDASFDAAYRLHAPDAATARAVLTADMRREILALRERTAGALPTTAAGGMAAGLLLGTFDVDADVARYVIYGSPTRALAEQARAAAPLLLRLAGRTPPPG